MQRTDVKNRLTEYPVLRIEERQAIERRDTDTAVYCRKRLEALQSAVETALLPLEQDVIKGRYFVEYLPLRRWKEVSTAVFGSANAAHMQAAYRAHHKALEKLKNRLSYNKKRP